jgi:hypothetical protein
VAELNLFNIKGSDFLPGSDCAYVPPDRPFVELAHSLVYTSPLLQSGDIRMNERQPVNTEGIFIITGIQVLTPVVNTPASGNLSGPDLPFQIDFNAVALGAAGDGITLTVQINGPSLPLLVQSVVGKTITIQLQSDSGSGGLTTCAQLLSLLEGTPAITALLQQFDLVMGTGSTLVSPSSGTTSGGSTFQDILYVRFQWPNGRYTSNIRVDHTVCYAPYKDTGPSLTSNVGVMLPRPTRIEPVVCLPGTDIGIEIENRASLAQPAFAGMIEFRGRLRRFLKS